MTFPLGTLYHGTKFAVEGLSEALHYELGQFGVRVKVIEPGLVAMEAVARKLAMSKRSLQRKIEVEGTSYQQILKETREALARHSLEKTTLPPAEISLLLGFDEPNSFYRAFRKWTGTTPDSVRTKPTARA